jgi:hypothetical protein
MLATSTQWLYAIVFRSSPHDSLASGPRLQTNDLPVLGETFAPGESSARICWAVAFHATSPCLSLPSSTPIFARDREQIAASFPASQYAQAPQKAALQGLASFSSRVLRRTSTLRKKLDEAGA